MAILTVNTGSSSVRMELFETGAGARLKRVATTHHEDASDDPTPLLEEFLRQHDAPQVRMSAHRVVHGGARLTAPCRLSPEVEQEIERLSPLAPLHNPIALKWIRATRGVLGAALPQVAVFDTAFFAGLPEAARAYAIPQVLAERHGVRRFGFHGLAHQAMWRRWREWQPEVADGGRLISFQLGAGCSATAVVNGTPCDTSMGFSPLEGLMMATRSGDIDPGALTFLQRRERLTPEQTDHLLNASSGLLGVSGISADMRVLLQSSEPRAALAVEMYCRRARKYLGAYLALMGGADAIVFGGGVGENSSEVRARVLDGMGWAGIRLDPSRNTQTKGVEGCISTAGSPVSIWVASVDEAAILAQEALAVVQ